MPNGVSATTDCTGKGACLIQAGFSFVIRYYFNVGHNKDRLTLAEAQALCQAGLTVAAVFEDGPTDPSYFSKSRGMQDGAYAYAYARDAIGQPAGSAIYFAVDYDAARGDVSGVINDYFQGVAQGFANAAQGQVAYGIGVYGSGFCCQWLQANNPAVQFTWVAESGGWDPGSPPYTSWNIQQQFMKTSVCGFRVFPSDPDNNDAEVNVTQGAIGDFTVGASPAALTV